MSNGMEEDGQMKNLTKISVFIVLYNLSTFYYTYFGTSYPYQMCY